MRRLRDQLLAVEEQIDQIAGALDVIDAEQLADAIANTNQGDQLKRALANIRQITSRK